MTATLTAPPVVIPSVAPAAIPPAPAVVWPPTSPELLEFRASLVRFTWADMQKMWEAGILYEDSSTELLDGLLVYRDRGSTGGVGMATGTGHEWTVGQVGELGRQIERPNWHVRTQATLRMSDTYSPVPDGMILRGPLADYRRRPPTPADVLCLIEVADSSYARDAGEKRDAYAAAGVPQYVIIDLRRRLAEVYAGPAGGTYPPPAIVAADGALMLRVGDDGQTVDVPLADLLP